MSNTCRMHAHTSLFFVFFEVRIVETQQYLVTAYVWCSFLSWIYYNERKQRSWPCAFKQGGKSLQRQQYFLLLRCIEPPSCVSHAPLLGQYDLCPSFTSSSPGLLCPLAISKYVYIVASSQLLCFFVLSAVPLNCRDAADKQKPSLQQPSLQQPSLGPSRCSWGFKRCWTPSPELVPRVISINTRRHRSLASTRLKNPTIRHTRSSDPICFSYGAASMGSDAAGHFKTRPRSNETRPETSRLLLPYLNFFVSVKRTCWRTIGSYLRRDRRSGVVLGFLRVT